MSQRVNDDFYNYVDDYKLELLEDFLVKNKEARDKFFRFAQVKYMQKVDKEIDDKFHWCNNVYKNIGGSHERR